MTVSPTRLVVVEPSSVTRHWLAMSQAALVVCACLAGLAIVARAAAGVLRRRQSFCRRAAWAAAVLRPAVGESYVILLHLPLPLVGVSIWTGPCVGIIASIDDGDEGVRVQ